MLQKLPVNEFEWIDNTSKFNEDFIKNNNEDSDKGYFLKADVPYSEISQRKNENQKSLIYMKKLNMLIT